MATIAIPIPAQDFDPTEVAVSWKILRDLGHEVIFATPDGKAGAADQIMIDGIGLDPWSRIPLLRRVRLIGSILRANSDARRAYREMVGDHRFRQPLRWEDLVETDYAALVLTGGHRARGMRASLESPILQQFTAAFFAANKPVGAICHGVVLAARSLDSNGRSVLYGRRTTALTWQQEKTADRMAHVGRWWDPDYYRTYTEADGQPEGYRSVESEVTRALATSTDFLHVATGAPDYGRKTNGMYRDTASDPRAAFVVVDGNYVSARWPGDAHLFAITLGQVIATAHLLNAKTQSQSPQSATGH